MFSPFYTGKKWSLWDFKTLAQSIQLKIILKHKVLDSVFLISNFLTQFYGSFHVLLLGTASRNRAPPDWLVNCKTGDKSADVWGVREIIRCTPMPHSILLFGPLSAIITQPNVYSLFFQASWFSQFWMRWSKSCLEQSAIAPVRRNRQSPEMHLDMFPISCKKSYMLQEVIQHVCDYHIHYKNIFCHAD